LTQFALALAAFFALHSIPAVPGVRRRLVRTLGARSYLLGYSVISIAGLAWLFHAAFALDYIELWPAAPWQAWPAILLAPVSVFLIAAGLISGNPASIAMRRAGTRPGAIVAITRHPVLWGFLLWALSHVLANGDLRSLLLFGSLALFSAAGMWLVERRHRRTLGADWIPIQSSSSILPFAAIVQGRARLRLDREMGIALVLSVLVTIWLLSGGHAALFGADPLAMAAP
jgi:uncharacterized membrane protein